MCHHAKFHYNQPSGFGDISIFWCSGWLLILNFSLNFWSTVRLGGLICIATSNFTESGQTVAEISHLTIFKMALVHHLGLLKDWFWTAGKLWRTNMCHHAKFCQNQPNSFWDISIFYLQDGRHPPFCIFKFLVSHQVERAKMHHHTKFHQNWSNSCRDIAFNVFQNGGRPPSWIVEKLIF